MTDALASTFQPVVDRLNTNAGLSPALALLIGAEHLGENAAPRRIVWVPVMDAYGGAAQHGRAAKTVKENTATFAVHCWGTTIDETRALRDALLVALHQKGGASLEATGAEWLHGERGAWIKRGYVLVVRVTLAEPITAAPWTFAPITDESLEAPAGGATPGDGNLDSTET